MSILSKTEQSEFNALLRQITPPREDVRRMMTPTELKVMAFDASERLKLAKLRAGKLAASASPRPKAQPTPKKPADGLTKKQRELQVMLENQTKQNGG